MKKPVLILAIIFFCFACKDEPKTSETDLELITEDTLVGDINLADTLKTNVEKPKKESLKDIKAALAAKGFKTFDFVDEKTKDTILMQKYFMAFLKAGPIRGQNEEENAELQKEHMAHLRKMYDLGYADISGPFDDNSDIRGITIYNVPTLKMADSLANADPMVKARRLEIEIHPWWAAKGFPLR